MSTRNKDRHGAAEPKNVWNERAKQHGERMTHLVMKSVGTNAHVGMVDGSQLKGVLHSVNPSTAEFPVAISDARRIATDNHLSSAIKPGVTCAGSDWSTMTCFGVPDQPNVSPTRRRSAKSSGMKTDASIAKNNKHSASSVDRPLEPWGSSQASDGHPAGLLESNTTTNDKRPWDQFTDPANKTVQSSYHEDQYTTKLDKRELSSQQIKDAERKAREIIEEGTFEKDEAEGEEDEELAFSAVVGTGSYKRNGGYNRHASLSTTNAAATSKKSFADTKILRGEKNGSHELKAINALNLEPALRKIENDEHGPLLSSWKGTGHRSSAHQVTASCSASTAAISVSSGMPPCGPDRQAAAAQFRQSLDVIDARRKTDGGASPPNESCTSARSTTSKLNPAAPEFIMPRPVSSGGGGATPGPKFSSRFTSFLPPGVKATGVAHFRCPEGVNHEQFTAAGSHVIPYNWEDLIHQGHDSSTFSYKDLVSPQQNGGGLPPALQQFAAQTAIVQSSTAGAAAVSQPPIAHSPMTNLSAAAAAAANSAAAAVALQPPLFPTNLLPIISQLATCSYSAGVSPLLLLYLLSQPQGGLTADNAMAALAAQAAQGLAVQGLAVQGMAAQGMSAQGLAAQGLAAQGMAAQGLAAQSLAAAALAAAPQPGGTPGNAQPVGPQLVRQGPQNVPPPPGSAATREPPGVGDACS